MATLKALATVRRLVVPVVQVNVARNQVNVAGAGARGNSWSQSAIPGFGCSLPFPGISLVATAGMGDSHQG